MPTKRKLAPVTQSPRIDFVIPREIIEAFAGKPHIVVGPGGGTNGIWVDIAHMKDPEFWKNLTASPEFNKNFEVMLVLRQ